jgi:NCS1 family nucleobase:cation symporter-1
MTTLDYVAYPVGLIIAFGVYALANKFLPPANQELFRQGWLEPKDYVEESDVSMASHVISGQQVESEVPSDSGLEKEAAQVSVEKN